MILYASGPCRSLPWGKQCCLFVIGQLSYHIKRKEARVGASYIKGTLLTKIIFEAIFWQNVSFQLHLDDMLPGRKEQPMTQMGWYLCQLETVASCLQLSWVSSEPGPSILKNKNTNTVPQHTKPWQRLLGHHNDIHVSTTVIVTLSEAQRSRSKKTKQK